MSCEYNSTAAAPGDSVVDLLRKLVQSLGGTFGCGENEWTLVAKVLALYGGSPAPGDTITGMWEKLRLIISSEECNCGNAEWDAIDAVLNSVSPGAFATGDARYDLLRKLLEEVNRVVVPPVTPDPPPPDPPPPDAPFFVSFTSNPFTAATASPTVNYPTPQIDDVWLAIFTTNTTHSTSGTPPAGWFKLNELNEAVDHGSSVFWKRSTGLEPASEVWTSIFSTTETGLSVVIAYRGCITTGSPVNASTASIGFAMAGHTAGPIITLAANSMVVGIITFDPPFATSVFAWDAGITERVDMQAAGSIAMITVGDKVNPTPSSISLGGTVGPTPDSALRFIYALTPEPV